MLTQFDTICSFFRFLFMIYKELSVHKILKKLLKTSPDCSHRRTCTVQVRELQTTYSFLVPLSVPPSVSALIELHYYPSRSLRCRNSRHYSRETVRRNLIGCNKLGSALRHLLPAAVIELLLRRVLLQVGQEGGG